MSLRFMSAVVVGLTVASAQIAAPAAWAQQVAIATPSSAAKVATAVQAISAVIRDNADAIRAAPVADRLGMIQTLVLGVLSDPKAALTPAEVVAALTQAVQAGIITAQAAVAIATAVSADLGQQVAAANGIITGATGVGGSVSVLTSLDAGAPGGGADGDPYDPCAGVIAAYCGS